MRTGTRTPPLRSAPASLFPCIPMARGSLMLSRTRCHRHRTVGPAVLALCYTTPIKKNAYACKCDDAQGMMMPYTMQGRASFRWFASEKGGFPVHPHYTKCDDSEQDPYFKIARTHAFAVSLLLQIEKQAVSFFLLLPRAHVRSIIWSSHRVDALGLDG